MLLDFLVNYCDKQYSETREKTKCVSCKHIGGCTGSCKQCLEEIHYPSKYPNGYRYYCCPHLINFYMCCYSYKYASEVLYALRTIESLKKAKELNIVSIGCGGCPDLMAIESYIKEFDLKSSISYMGFDKNQLWKPVHNQIIKYTDDRKIYSIDFEYVDILNYFESYDITDINVLFLQYFISCIYKHGDSKSITLINQFFQNLIDSVIKLKESKEIFYVIINDVNSNNLGRTTFENFSRLLKKNGLHIINETKYYFDYNIKNFNQRYGNCHINNDVLYTTFPRIIRKYDPWCDCSSAQLILEIK